MHGFLLINKRLLLLCDTGIYTIIQCNVGNLDLLAGINDKDNIIDSDTGLRYVCGQNDLKIEIIQNQLTWSDTTNQSKML